MEICKIFGSPGTGKTSRLLEILESELKTVYPDRIAFVSFTRKGAYEGRSRAMQKFGYTENDLPFFRTLHSLAYQQTGMTKRSIINNYQYKKFSESMGMWFSGNYNIDMGMSNDMFLFYEALQRNSPVLAENFLYNIDIKTYHYVKKNYKAFKKALRIYDFTDILELYITNGLPLDIDIAIVDEAQDMTTLQWKMINFAFSKCKRLYIAGDDDQSIYEWAGADVKYYLDFGCTDMEILQKTHRLPENILKFSEKIVKTINNRVEKDTVTTKPGGEIQYINDLKELNIDNINNWLFLARNMKSLSKIKKYLQDKGLLYRYKHTPSVNVLDINAIIHYTNVCNGKDNLEAYKLYSYIDNFEFCKFDKPWFDVLNFEEDTKLYYRDLAANGNIKNKIEDIKIDVDTIHGSKGGEADNVVLISDISSMVENNKNKNYDSEMRVLYVGITRTKKNLYIVNPETGSYYNELF
jgi:superfamily I DNA/RNA helicase